MPIELFMFYWSFFVRRNKGKTYYFKDRKKVITTRTKIRILCLIFIVVTCDWGSINSSGWTSQATFYLLSLSRG